MNRPMPLSSLFDSPIGYLAFQYLIGGRDARRRCIQQHIKTFAGMRILDIGCGPGFIADWLDGVDYYGMDTDPNYIRYAQRKYGHKGTFTCELFTEDYVSRHKPFDLIIMMGVLHHLDDSQAVDILCLIKKSLVLNGKLVTLDGHRFPGLSAAQKFMLDNDRGKFIRTKEEYLKLCGSVFDHIQVTDHPEYFNIPYTSLVLECSSKAAS